MARCTKILLVQRQISPWFRNADLIRVKMMKITRRRISIVIAIVFIVIIVIIIVIILIIIITRPRPAFGRLGLGGLSRGYSSNE